MTGEVPDGSLIAINSSNDPSSRLFVNAVVEGALGGERRIVYFASPGMREALESDVDIDDESSIIFIDVGDMTRWPSSIPENSLVVFDSFSYLVLDKRIFQVSPILEEMKKRAVIKNSVVVLNLESGMLEPRFETLINYLADGVLDFRVRENSDSVQRYMMVPKWRRSSSIDTNIYFTIERGRIKFDLRSRVV